jgi:hypothetical protein
MPRRFLLSIDGGGVRGIVPALALARLEEITGRPARETFSFVAGTSTGALLAAAVAAGLPATQMVALYRDRTREIFSPRGPWNGIRRVVIGHQYNISNLRRVLESEFGAAVSWNLNNSPVDLLLPAIRLSDAKPWYFVKDNPNNAGSTGALGLLDCATASAAAPTYFDSWPMGNPVNGKLVDGGVGTTGNPVYQACVEAFCFSQGYGPAETTVVSFGTGRIREHADPHFILSWLTWVVDTVLHAPEEQQTQLVARHYPDALLYRLDPLLAEDIDLDDVTRIGELEAAGRLFADQVDWPAMLEGRPTPFLRHAPPCPGAGGAANVRERLPARD